MPLLFYKRLTLVNGTEVDFDVHSPREIVGHVLEACGVDELFGLAHPDPAC